MAKKQSKAEKPKVEIPEGLDPGAVHIFRKLGTSRELVATNPYMRFRKRYKTPEGERDDVVLLQQGKFFYESGIEIETKDLPAWLAGELKKANPEVLEECGLKPAA